MTDDPLSLDALAHARAVIEKTSPGPWESSAGYLCGPAEFTHVHGGVPAGANPELYPYTRERCEECNATEAQLAADYDFIVLSRTLLPLLLDAYEREKARLDWLDENPSAMTVYPTPRAFDNSVRAAIDAAMEET